MLKNLNDIKFMKKILNKEPSKRFSGNYENIKKDKAF